MVLKQNRHDYFNGATWNSLTAFSRHAVSKRDFNLSSFIAASCRCLVHIYKYAALDGIPQRSPRTACIRPEKFRL